MTKKHTETDIKRAFRSGRNQGRKEAREFLQQRINAIQVTNRQLLKEIMRLDSISPVAGVVLPYKYIEKLIRKLKSNKQYGYANSLQKQINESNSIDIKQVLKTLEDTSSNTDMAKIVGGDE